MTVPVLVLALLLQARASSAANESPQVAVGAVDARFVLDLHDKKMDDLLTLYSKDAVFVQPDGKKIASSGLRALYQATMKAFDSDLHLKRLSFKHSITTVIEDGSYTEALVRRNSRKTENVQGTYRFTLHLDPDGEWRYSRMEWH
jgi:ketosteroid isomerase-like protein